jgi:hypothetical protein
MKERFLPPKSALPEILARRQIHNAKSCELGAGEQFRRQAHLSVPTQFRRLEEPAARFACVVSAQEDFLRA